MKVLVACEESGIVRDAFRAVGHDAWSCDFQECSGDPEYHIKDDALIVLSNEPWDLVISHPPCTYLANSGVRWLYNDDMSRNSARWEKMEDGAEFFRAFIDHHAFSGTPLCIENPIPHKHAHLPAYSQCVQPWMFGDNYSKATCFWLYGLPPLIPAVMEHPENVLHACHMEPPGPNRQKNRSKTYPGIARAMAQQWGTDFTPTLELSA